MVPVWPFKMGGQPWHSLPTEFLPKVYQQTAGLEFAWAEAVIETETISGEVIAPLILDFPESLDINTWEDWGLAELVAKARPDLLPRIP